MKKTLTARVLLVVDRRLSSVAQVLRRAGVEIETTYSVDHAVALCVSHEYDAVVLDQDFYVEVDGWSVAQSLKLVKANQCIVLVTSGKPFGKQLPRGVDAVIESRRLRELPQMLRRLHQNGRAARP